MEDKEFHLRAKQKKHEADLEKDKIKKSILYMEAVCNFFLCAVYQYRHNKKSINNSSSSTAVSSSSSAPMTSIISDLIKGTIGLLE